MPGQRQGINGPIGRCVSGSHRQKGGRPGAGSDVAQATVPSSAAPPACEATPARAPSAKPTWTSRGGRQRGQPDASSPQILRGTRRALPDCRTMAATPFDLVENASSGRLVLKGRGRCRFDERPPRTTQAIREAEARDPVSRPYAPVIGVTAHALTGDAGALAWRREWDDYLSNRSARKSSRRRSPGMAARRHAAFKSGLISGFPEKLSRRSWPRLPAMTRPFFPHR